MRVLRRLLVPFLVMWAMLALWSGFRAIVQVFRLEVVAPATPVGEGSAVGARVVASGRATVTVRLELVQGATTATLGEFLVHTSRDPALDPVPKRGMDLVRVTREVLDRFTAGPAVVRVTATGRAQWMRLPPPTVRETRVTLAP